MYHVAENSAVTGAFWDIQRWMRLSSSPAENAEKPHPNALRISQLFLCVLLASSNLSNQLARPPGSAPQQSDMYSAFFSPGVVMNPVLSFCNGRHIVGVCENATSCAAGNSSQFHAIIVSMSPTAPLSNTRTVAALSMLWVSPGPKSPI